MWDAVSVARPGDDRASETVRTKKARIVYLMAAAHGKDVGVAFRYAHPIAAGNRLAQSNARISLRAATGQPTYLVLPPFGRRNRRF